MATVAILVGEGFEDSEFTVPHKRISEAGHVSVLLGEKTGQTLHGKQGKATAHVEQAVADADPEAFDALVIPGGKGPAAIRGNPDVVAFVKRFVQTGRPLAAICHGPQLLVEADAVRGRRLTSWPQVRQELEDAGAEWVDQEVVLEGQLITSRKPEDLDAFCRALLERLEGNQSHADPAGEGAQGVPYGRQTHGGQSYGESGTTGQPLADAGEVKEAGSKRKGRGGGAGMESDAGT